MNFLYVLLLLLLLLRDVHLYYVFILSVSLSSESADDSDDVNDFRPGRQNVKKRERVLLLSLLWGCEEEIRKKLDRFPKKRRKSDESLFFAFDRNSKISLLSRLLFSLILSFASKEALPPLYTLSLSLSLSLSF
jgi:hypothetical protein